MANTIFKPLIFESFGGIPEKSKNILNRLSMDLRHVERRYNVDIYNHLKRKIVLLIWKTNWENAKERIDWTNDRDINDNTLEIDENDMAFDNEIDHEF